MTRLDWLAAHALGGAMSSGRHQTPEAAALFAKAAAQTLDSLLPNSSEDELARFRRQAEAEPFNPGRPHWPPGAIPLPGGQTARPL